MISQYNNKRIDMKNSYNKMWTIMKIDIFVKYTT